MIRHPFPMPHMTPNYDRPSFQGSQWKGQIETKATEREHERRKDKRMDAKEKEAVRARDKEACRVCLRKTRDVHERLFKSLGGVASLVNSLCACKRCHPLLQGHAIRPVGQSCNHPLTFQMTEKTAHLVFRGRAVPNHVEIVKVVQRDDEAREEAKQ